MCLISVFGFALMEHLQTNLSGVGSTDFFITFSWVVGNEQEVCHEVFQAAYSNWKAEEMNLDVLSDDSSQGHGVGSSQCDFTTGEWVLILLFASKAFLDFQNVLKVSQNTISTQNQVFISAAFCLSSTILASKAQ